MIAVMIEMPINKSMASSSDLVIGEFESLD